MSSVLNLPPRIEMINGEKEILEFLKITNGKQKTSTGACGSLMNMTGLPSSNTMRKK